MPAALTPRPLLGPPGISALVGTWTGKLFAKATAWTLNAGSTRIELSSDSLSGMKYQLVRASRSLIRVLDRHRRPSLGVELGPLTDLTGGIAIILEVLGRTLDLGSAFFYSAIMGLAICSFLGVMIRVPYEMRHANSIYIIGPFLFQFSWALYYYWGAVAGNDIAIFVKACKHRANCID